MANEELQAAYVDFNQTIRRNPHYSGAGGFKRGTIAAIQTLIETKILDDKNGES